MAKIIGPLSSAIASGHFDTKLIYSHVRGRPYTKRYRKPHNPKTQWQTGLRSLIPFICREWSLLNVVDQTSWAELADALNLPLYHAFLKGNQSLWPHFIAPIKNANNPGSDTPGVHFDTTTYYETNLIRIRCRMIPANDCWGFIFCMDYPTYPYPSLDRTVGVSPLDGTSSAWYTHTQMTPGIYYYRFAHFTYRGTMTISSKTRRIIIS